MLSASLLFSRLSCHLGRAQILPIARDRAFVQPDNKRHKIYAYDGRNQLTAITDTAAGNTTLSYDIQGNLSQNCLGNY
jgi:YD repeat-containing protein